LSATTPRSVPTAIIRMLIRSSTPATGSYESSRTTTLAPEAWRSPTPLLERRDPRGPPAPNRTALPRRQLFAGDSCQ
jgi:hypothetical protein